jgi:preprotein translocase subunit YajC
MTLPIVAALMTTPAEGGNPLLPFLFQIAAIFGIFYFVMIRPQQRQRQEHEKRISDLRKGDEVVVAGGIIGEVIHIKETVVDGAPKRTLDDRITVKTGESRIVVERRSISKVLTAPAPVPTSST